jgi:hypothetical protein
MPIVDKILNGGLRGLLFPKEVNVLTAGWRPRGRSEYAN